MNEVTSTSVRVEGPRFTAGVELEDDRVVRMAPILSAHIGIGWSTANVIAVCTRKGWLARKLEG